MDDTSPKNIPLTEKPTRAQRISMLRAQLTDAYGIVLALLLLVIILPAALPEGTAGDVVISTVSGLAVLISLHSSRVPQWVFLSACVIVAGAVMATFAGDEIDGDLWHSLGSMGLGLLLIISPVAILNRIARHRRITSRTIFGALCFYLQLGLAFSFLFRAIDSADPTSITGADLGDRVAYVYYSFVTMTTLGYGDITPVSDWARTLAILETLTGQVFLVVVVARLVSMLGRERPEPADRLTLRDRLNADIEDDEQGPAPAG
jgi:hypothetical protein